MKPSIRWRALRDVALHEVALRFAFGGAIAVAAGLVLHFAGPLVGGLFLAFPAILPASLTLVRRHDGRACATDDARGACIGSVGLAAFAIVVAEAAGYAPAIAVLVAATLAWALVTSLGWLVFYG